MSYIFPSDQDRADYDQLNEACEHIEELMDQLASRQALEGETVRGYSYELATCTDEDGEYCNWSLSINHQKPNVPADSIRNLEPLYTHPAIADVPPIPEIAAYNPGPMKPLDYWLEEFEEYADYHSSLVYRATIKYLRSLHAHVKADEPFVTGAIVPKGWTIKPFDCFDDKGISVLWPDNRGGAHLRAHDPKNSIAQNLLYDLANALLFDSPARDRPSLGQRKADQVGTTIGVLVQNQNAEWWR